MLIGVDASRTTAVRRTGTENYSLHLIRELLVLGGAHHFRLYFNQAPAEGLLPAGAEHQILPFPRLWTHVRLSWEMLTDPPDILFVPSHVLPLIHPQRSVVTVHDLGYLYYPEAHTLSQNLYLRWSTRHNARTATRVLADSKATRQDLIDHYQVPPEKVAVVYPGRDEALTRVDDAATMDTLRKRYGLPGPYLLYVGTLQPRKNLVRLVQAFAVLLRSLPSNEPENPSSTPNSLSAGLSLVLAGKAGWLSDEILAQVRKLELNDRVILPGYVPDSDLPALLSGALAFVYPSLYEGFGLPVLEAMACGTPVVCSNSSSLPEVAGDAALLVDPLAPEALAEAMRRVIAEDGLRREMVQRGARQVRRFSWQRSAREVWSILQEAGRGLD